MLAILILSIIKDISTLFILAPPLALLTLLTLPTLLTLLTLTLLTILMIRQIKRLFIPIHAINILK